MLFVTRGLPASGKTTWTREYVAEDPGNRVAASRDGFRALLTADPSSPHGVVEDEVTQIQRAAVEGLLKSGKTVVIDDTNLPFGRVRDWATVADNLGVPFEVKDFTDVSLEECLRRNRDRVRIVPERVIRDMHQRYIKGAKVPETWEPKKRAPAKLDIHPYQPVPGTPEAILVDVDGTIAQMTSGRGPFDWARVGEDSPNQVIIDYVGMHHDAGRKVIIMSGRLDVCRTETIEWLREHLKVPFVGPFMRRRTSAPDDLIKLELFNEHIRNDYTIHSVLDDRDRVVQMWRDLGLTCLQVAPGDF